MAKKKYQEGIKIARSVGETGKTVVKIKTYFILSLILISVIVIGVVIIQLDPLSPQDVGTNGYSGLPEPIYDELNSPSTPILDSIETDSYLDGSVELSWSESIIPTGASYLIGYSVYRKKDSGSWILNQVLAVRSHVDLISVVSGEYHEYSYTVLASYIITVEFPPTLYTSQYSNIQFISVGDLNPLTDPSVIINSGAETTDTYEVTLTLSCDNAELMRFKLSSDSDWTIWESFKTTRSVTLPGNSTDNPYYTVKAQFSNVQGETGENEAIDGITYVGILVLPSNPSISINNGLNTTNSFENNILTLYCDDAEGMQFRINEGIWTDWVAYSTTHTITLPENDTGYPNYRVEVIFENSIGTTEDAGYTDIHDDITYEPEGEPPPPLPESDKKDDYTLTYILVAVLGGGIGIVVFITYRKKKDKRIRYTTKKGKSRVIKPLKLKCK